MMVAVSVKSIGTGGLISPWNVLPYFSAMEHRVHHQPAVAAARSLIVFSVNSYGITGIVPMETDVITRLTRLGSGEINFHL
jgi:hypothetical protein